MFLTLFLLLSLAAQCASPAYKEDPCEEELDPGPCQYYQIKWFWDQQDEECKEFHYGGCMGTRNRFNTKQACVKQCRYKLFNPIAVPDLCLLPPDQGHCGDERVGQWWFFFNSDSACDSCDTRTSICKSHSKFNYTCECRMGYEKNNMEECIDVDECRGGMAACDRNAWCTNTLGSYSCECMAAYRGNGKHCSYVGLGRSTLNCEDCAFEATCNNGVCQCKEGFQGDGFNCTDVNECLKLPYICDRNAECVNREGSAICTCLPGYAGNGYNCTKSKTACLDKFDRGYQETCGKENWREHYYLEHSSKTCALFWYDGCPGNSRNIFSDFETCQNMCEETNVLTRAEICWDHFDVNYRNQCMNGRWEQRHYFDHASLTCRQFWYDGCRSPSRNMFEDSLTCQWLCESQPMYKSRSCLEDFDHHYKDMCNGGRWRQQFYFDRNSKKCVPFWYDGCRGSSQNIFQDELSCTKTCEEPAKRDRLPPLPRIPPHAPGRPPSPPRPPEITHPYNRVNPYGTRQHPDPRRPYQPLPRYDPRTRNDARLRAHVTVWPQHNIHAATQVPTSKQIPRVSAIQPWHTNDKALMKERLGEVFKPNLTNVCETTNPCKNNATCIFAWKKNTYYCKCKPGWTGSHCTEVMDFDPCALFPCRHGSTCKAKTEKGKTTHECFCPTGYGGPNCDQKPCDVNPCHNNGTCRTTTAASSFFCDCPPAFGGKHCEFDPETRKQEREQRQREEDEAKLKQRMEEEEARQKEAQLEEERKENEARLRELAEASGQRALFSTLITGIVYPVLLTVIIRSIVYMY